MSYFSKLPSEMKRIAVGILGFDGITTLDLTGPLEVLASTQLEGVNGRTNRCYDVFIIGLTSKTFVSEAGLVFQAPKTLKTAPWLDTVIIPGGLGIRSTHTATKISDWLSKRANSLRRIVAVSTGIYAVAPTGLLNGRQVTTHWRFAQGLARQFPHLRVNHTASFLKDGAFYSCGAGAAAIEMTLSLIEEDYGVQTALSIAREFVTELRPPGNAERSVEAFDYQVSATDRLADLPAWVVAHLRDNLCVEALAERAGLCPRHFGRLFKRLFNCPPADFVEQLRLSEARRRLLLPRNSVASVATSVGFKSADAFRRAFERRFGVTPRDFRGRFGNRTKSDLRDPQAALTALS